MVLRDQLGKGVPLSGRFCVPAGSIGTWRRLGMHRAAPGFGGGVGTFDVVGERLPVLVGAGGPDTREVLRKIEYYGRWNCAGYLVSPPSYA
ncbi:hypothetical protein [Trinickia mobilis]|uniref:hypothetical protein n=1 Tax=Trinickia mobilis TaxID=2816356 RepID=UPI001A8E9D92|nr:hypothetical protein [Trinickia mobilis]